jgi:VanZ family protein
MPRIIVRNQRAGALILKLILALKPRKDVMAASRLDKKTITRLWFPVVLCMGLIFYVSSIPGRNLPVLFPSQDIVFHLLAYLLLAYFFSRALKKSFVNIRWHKIILFTVIFGVAYGVSDEIHQFFVPYRCVSGFDVFMDGIGSFIGSLIYR